MNENFFLGQSEPNWKNNQGKLDIESGKKELYKNRWKLGIRRIDAIKYLERGTEFWIVKYSGQINES